MPITTTYGVPAVCWSIQNALSRLLAQVSQLKWQTQNLVPGLSIHYSQQQKKALSRFGSGEAEGGENISTSQ